MKVFRVSNVCLIIGKQAVAIYSVFGFAFDSDDIERRENGGRRKGQLKVKGPLKVGPASITAVSSSNMEQKWIITHSNIATNSFITSSIETST